MHQLKNDFETRFRAVREKAGPYPVAAYQFVREGLAHTAKTLHGELPEDAGAEERASQDAEATLRSRHVSGAQLCVGLRDYAISQYGRLARTVLARWYVHSTEDFGRIVFAMIDLGIMRKTDDDRAEDFVDVYDFDEAFAALPMPI